MLPLRLGRLTQESTRMELQPGSAAPDFTLASHTDQKISLAAYRGRPTVVSFLPFAFTGG
jgi:peroxiredoxin